jgi:membrane protein
VPFLLFSFALLGFLDLGDIWQKHVAGHERPNVSPAGFKVINETVTAVLGSRQVFWMTAGLLVAVWQISGAVRAVMGALNRIYRVERDRSWRRRMALSTGLAVEVGFVLIAATVVVTLGPLLYRRVSEPLEVVLFIARWSIAGVLMLLGVGLLLHHSPAKDRPIRWVSFGTLLIVGSWIAMSIGFGLYLHYVADYESVFGNLASVVVLMGYIYTSALVFLGGAQLDALVRRRVEGA